MTAARSRTRDEFLGIEVEDREEVLGGERRRQQRAHGCGDVVMWRCGDVRCGPASSGTPR